VPLIISSGDFDQNIRRLRQEAGTAVAHGLPHAEALRAVTKTPAEVFGRGAELGTVAVGKRADLVLWSGDPFETSTIAERVFIAGREMDLSSRQRLLVERYLR
jgi:imidazolonepropionase-like amidohydrolase